MKKINGTVVLTITRFVKIIFETLSSYKLVRSCFVIKMGQFEDGNSCKI